MMSIHPSPLSDKADTCAPELDTPTPLAQLRASREEAQSLLAAVKHAQEAARQRDDLTALETATRRHGMICARLKSLDAQITDLEFEAFMGGMSGEVAA